MNKDLTYTVLQVDGMSCSNCANGIQKHLTKKGLSNCHVSFANAEVSVYHNNNWTKESLISEIESIGFKAKDNSVKSINYDLEKKFAISLFFTLPLFAHMFLAKEHLLQNPIIQIILCLPVFVIGLKHFGKSALNSLKIGSPNMDVLIMMGSAAAFFYSLWGVLLNWNSSQYHQFLFFETSATIITLVLLGNLLEKRSVKRTTSAIQELSSIQQLFAKRENTKGEIEEIPFTEIKKGDVLLVNSGDRIPTDAKIILGDGLLDESMITGENRPVNKTTHHEVVGGTILTQGNLKLKAKEVGEKTVLSQIIKLVKDAQNSKPKIQRLGDKVSSIFVPTVIFISLTTFLVSYFYFNVSVTNSMMRAIAVLVISCPCAMGLATPTAVMVGIGRAAKNGILIKGGTTLEEFAKVKKIVFDKTGTLTSGHFQIEKIHCKPAVLAEVKNIIYNLELNSSHPIAKSIVNQLKKEQKKVELEKINEIKGKGIEAEWNNHHYLLGSYSIAKEVTKEANHQLYLLKNGSLIASIEMSDTIKSSAIESIRKLNEGNIQTVMLSGDKSTSCQSLAKKLNIDDCYSEQLPAEKLSKIASFEKEAPTAMVGDGINDAPALTKARVGISLSNGTHIAIQSAQIIILDGDDLTKIPEALSISKQTLTTIKQNLFWAFSYNIVAIPIAAMGLLNPMWGVLFMAFSDIVVIGNSLRLKHKRLS